MAIKALGKSKALIKCQGFLSVSRDPKREPSSDIVDWSDFPIQSNVYRTLCIRAAYWTCNHTHPPWTLEHRTPASPYLVL